MPLHTTPKKPAGWVRMKRAGSSYMCARLSPFPFGNFPLGEGYLPTSPKMADDDGNLWSSLFLLLLERRGRRLCLNRAPEEWVILKKALCTTKDKVSSIYIRSGDALLSTKITGGNWFSREIKALFFFYFLSFLDFLYQHFFRKKLIAAINSADKTL